MLSLSCLVFDFRDQAYFLLLKLLRVFKLSENNAFADVVTGKRDEGNFTGYLNFFKIVGFLSTRATSSMVVGENTQQRQKVVLISNSN